MYSLQKKPMIALKRPMFVPAIHMIRPEVRATKVSHFYGDNFLRSATIYLKMMWTMTYK
jgi:hypothetical protein